MRKGRAVRWGLAIFLACIPMMAAAASRQQRSVPIFLSTDLGCEIDDQWPLVHLLTDRQFDVLAIGSAHAPSEAVPAPPAETSAALIRHIVKDRLRLAKAPPIVIGSNVPLADSATPRASPAVDMLLKTAARFNRSRRLTVLVTGAATDVASALLKDPSIADRIQIVAMGFKSADSGDEFNIRNDPNAWRVILNSRVPLTVGDQAVTSRRLSLTRKEARSLLDGLGPIGSWLLRDYDVWYDQVTRTFANPGRPNDDPNWPIWDEVVVAHLLGKTRSDVIARPVLSDDLRLVPGGEGTVVWIRDIDREAVFGDFVQNVRRYLKDKRLVDLPCVTVAREKTACARVAR